MAHIKALCALATPRDDAVSLAVRCRLDDFFAERRAAMTKHAEDMHRPYKWVRKLIDPSMSWSEQTGPLIVTVTLGIGFFPSWIVV